MKHKAVSETSRRGRPDCSSSPHVLPVAASQPTVSSVRTHATTINAARRTARPRLGTRDVFLLLGFAVLILLVVASLRWSSPHGGTFNDGVREECDEKYRLPGNTGFSNQATESTVLFLFDADGPPRRTTQRGEKATDALRHWFKILARAFLSPENGGAQRESTRAQKQRIVRTSSDFFDTTAATAWVVDRVSREATPLQMDVVYTYVNESTAGFTSRLHQRGIDTAHTKYFRDWGELRHSLRSLWHAVLAPEGGSARLQRRERRARDEAALAALGLTLVNSTVSAHACPAAQRSLVRQITVVVAADDQIPDWLFTGVPCGVRVVTHDALFSATEKAGGALPTFNSLAIESTLHRLPNLSRYWWYFNNDMLLGRPVTLFDLFRPLSPLRQRAHFGWYASDNKSGNVVDPGLVLPWEQDQLTAPHPWPQGCAALWLEPFIHSDHGARFSVDLALPLSRAALSSYMQSLTDPFLKGAPLRETEQVKRCAAQRLEDPVGHRAPWRTTMLTAPAAVRPALACPNALNRHAHYVAETAIEGVPPTMIYAHLPQVIDTHIFTRMLEDPVDGLVSEAQRIRFSFRRELNNFSPVHVYGYYALAMRRAVERDLWLRLGHTLQRRAAHGKRGTSQSGGRRQRAPDPPPLSFCRMCPLCAHTNTINLQHPDLHLELSAWWPPDRHLVEEGLPTATRLATNVPRECVAEPPSGDNMAQRLWELYLNLVGGDEVLDVQNVVLDRLTGLLTDVFHHTNDNVLRFVMIEDLLQLAMKVLRADASIRASDTPPLFTTINDDMPHAHIEQARSEPRTWLLYTTLINHLLSVSAYRGSDRCPFERGESPRPPRTV